MTLATFHLVTSNHMKKCCAILAFLCSILLPGIMLYAGTIWDGGGANTNINTSANWDDNANPAFDGTKSVTFATNGSTATINTIVSFLGITLNRDANFTIASGAGTLTIGSGGINASPATTSATGRTYTFSEGIILGNTQTWTVNNNGTGTTLLSATGGVSGSGQNLGITGTGNVTISGTVATGTGNLTKSGTGILTLGGANTYSGGTFLNAGTILAGNNAALGTGTLTIAGGTLASSSATARTLANTIVMNGNVTLGQAAGGTGALTLGNVDLGTATRTVTVNNASDIISGVISGTGGVNEGGDGYIDPVWQQYVHRGDDGKRGDAPDRDEQCTDDNDRGDPCEHGRRGP
jgi:autotransporter-associated beta strand protein